MNRLFANICSGDLTKSKQFYTSLFGLKVNYDSAWFVHLGDGEGRGLELGLIAKDHDVVPEGVRARPAGIFLTLVVEDVDVLHRQARDLGVPIIEAPTPTFYGQKRMLIEDPDGCVLDVSSVYSG